MTRPDSMGFFWEDIPEVKIKKEVVKRTPPEPTWLNDDYLPHLHEARTQQFDIYTDRELTIALMGDEPLIMDTECYPNYFLIAFMGIESKKVIWFEQSPYSKIPYQKLKWILENFLIIGFNSISYDLPMLKVCLTQCGTRLLKEASDNIIQLDFRPREIQTTYKTKPLDCNHIDLIELGQLRASLKLIAARIHSPVLQDLPFHPDKVLNDDQMIITRWYCVNDLWHTYLFYRTRIKEIQLREQVGKPYNLDLRSKSDAQIAEEILTKAVSRKTGRISPPYIEPGTVYRYNPPQYIAFKTARLQSQFCTVKNANFVVNEQGRIGLPAEWGDDTRKININKASYTIGIGGLHSTEEAQAFEEGNGYIIRDWDVKSYYPRIAVNNNYSPKHLGQAFMEEYKQIVNRRLHAQKVGNKTEADTLKITINGTFGKFGSPYSNLYSPDLVIQITLTGQLSLLMLIEEFELAGIRVVSANTDGVTAYFPQELEPRADAIVANWERIANFETEKATYLALYNRDVNNYLAIKKDGIKTKGVFTAGDLNKNPSGDIIIDCVVNWFRYRQHPLTTLYQCRDVTKFLFVRTVKGGAVKDGEFLGKVVRWYYSTEVTGEIVYAKSGNKVPKSDNSRPCMVLPRVFPQDIDYERYLLEVEEYFDGWPNVERPIMCAS
jgi:hypothetical protein